jgi:hypothetical protein
VKGGDGLTEMELREGLTSLLGIKIPDQFVSDMMTKYGDLNANKEKEITSAKFEKAVLNNEFAYLIKLKEEYQKSLDA